MMPDAGRPTGASVAVCDEAETLLDEGVQLSRSGDMASAVVLLQAAVESARAALPAPCARRVLPRAQWRLATAQHMQGHGVAAVSSARQAVDGWLALLPEAPAPDGLEITWELARCYADLSVFVVPAMLQDVDAVFGTPLYYAEQALVMARRLVAGGHPQGRTEEGTALHNIATAYAQIGEWAQARVAAGNAVEVREPLARFSNAPHLGAWELANTYRLFGHIAAATGDVTLAADALTRAGDIASFLGRAGDDVLTQTTASMHALEAQHPDALAGRTPGWYLR